MLHILLVAVWHFYLLNNDVNFLQDFWEPVKKGILFSLSLQHRNGAIAWNIDKSKKIDEDYLLTGCSSIAKSLECAIAICQVLKHQSFELKWRDAHLKLIVALENPAETFDLKKIVAGFQWIGIILFWVALIQKKELPL